MSFLGCYIRWTVAALLEWNLAADAFLGQVCSCADHNSGKDYLVVLLDCCL